MQDAMTNSAKPVPGAWMLAWNQGLFGMQGNLGWSTVVAIADVRDDV
jgi:hypothetical protein